MRAAAALLLAGLAASACTRTSDPSALWNIVHGQCVPHQEADRNPSPCAAVDLADGVEKGYAVLKDIRGKSQFLLIPTARISGIEDPALLAPGAVNYWDDAWRDRYFVEERLHTRLPREDMSLAVNSAYGRTQNQLHIHMDCIREDVQASLARNLEHVGRTWTQYPEPLAGRSYRAIRIDQASMAGANPFKLLADSGARIAADMGHQTLAVVGATFRTGTNGFIILAGHADLAAGNPGSAEELQDHDCKIVSK